MSANSVGVEGGVWSLESGGKTRFAREERVMEDWKEKVDAAYDMVHALCQPRGSAGSREWIMSIPARPDYDPDLVITSGLRAAAKEIDRLAAENAEWKRRYREAHERKYGWS